MSAISLEHLKSVLKSLSSTIFKNIEKVNSTAEQAQATADDAVKTSENKMDKVNPSGTGYIVMNPLMGREYGKNSSSFGRGSATAENAHAEGTSTASGYESHAEGNVSKATGTASHAEGMQTEANMTASHAEGGITKATYSYAHAEGYNTQATAQAAHAEGVSTQANSKGAHAEGLHTRAYVNNPGTHAQGRANIPDADGKYAHIVGNGKITNLDNTGVTSVETYSNAHTVDWEGSAWYAGNVYVGGTGQDDENASKLISEKQVGKGLKMVGNALTVDEGEYELIEKIIIGYELLTAKPADWETNWTAYYKCNVDQYKQSSFEQLTDATVPTWVENVYYRLSDEGAVRQVIRNQYPNGDKYNLKSIWIECEAEKGTANEYVDYRFWAEGRDSFSIYDGNAISSTAKAYAHISVFPQYGYFTGFSTQPITGTTQQAQFYRPLNYLANTTQFAPIYQVRCTAKAAFPIGTIIKIWGVRYNA